MTRPLDSFDYEAEDLDDDIGNERLFVIVLQRDFQGPHFVVPQVTIFTYYNDKDNAVTQRLESEALTYGECREKILELAQDNETWGLDTDYFVPDRIKETWRHNRD